MSIFDRLGEFVTIAATEAFSGVLEAVRTLFEGDPETRRRVGFSVAMIALSAKMAKADGIVTPDEVVAFQELFEIPDSEARNVARLYNLAKQDVAGYETYAAKMATLCGNGEANCLVLEDILDGLFHIAKLTVCCMKRNRRFLPVLLRYSLLMRNILTELLPVTPMKPAATPMPFWALPPMRRWKISRSVTGSLFQRRTLTG